MNEENGRQFSSNIVKYYVIRTTSNYLNFLIQRVYDVCVRNSGFGIKKHTQK